MGHRDLIASWVRALGLLARGGGVGRAAVVFATVLLPFMLWVSVDYGVTLDEESRQTHGESIWRFYAGRVTAEDTGAGVLRFYGGLFDMLAVALQRGLRRVLPLDPYVVRHGLNATFGWLGVVLCGVLAARVAGPGAGLLAMVLLLLLPRYFGHAMNNPKDLPFATLATAALVVMAGIPARYPFLTWPRVAGLALTIGLCLSVRPGGMLFLAFAGGVLVVQVARSRDRDWRRLGATAARLALLTLLALTVPLPFWPWLQSRPYVGLAEALSGVADFEWPGSVLFDGRDLPGTRLPWTYVPVWFLYTTPLATLAGLALSLGRLHPRSPLRLVALGLWAAVLAPVSYIIARNSTLYDGIRHLLFIQPPLMVLSALGWWSVVRARSRPIAVTAVLVLAVGLAEPALFSLRNHPNQVVYFNPLLGGTRGAFGRFELDYWGNCVFQAQRHAGDLAREAGMQVVVSGRPWVVVNANSPRIPETTVAPLHDQQHHVEIALLRGPRKDVLAIARRPDILARVATADGAMLCAVLPGPAWPELDGRLRIARDRVAGGPTRP